MKQYTILIFCCIFLILGCKKTNSIENLPTSSLEFGTNTILIDSATSSKLQSIDSTHIVFNGNSNQLDKLVIGNIIISGPANNAPAGFLRKISSISKIGNIYTILTLEASLIEAFKNLHIDFTTSPANFLVSAPNTVLYDSDGNNSTTDDQFKVSVNLQLIPKFHIKIDINNYKLDYAKLEGNFESSLNTSIFAGGSIGSFSREINIYSQPIGLFIIPGTPIVIVTFLRTSLGANGTVNVQIIASDTKITNTNAYLEYQNNNWDKGSLKSMTNEFTFSGIVGNANSKVYIEPAIDFKLWGSNWAKGSIKSQGYLNAYGQLLPTQTCELKAGINAGAEANLKFFNLTFDAATYPSIFDFSKILYSCNNQLPTISTTAASNITTSSVNSGGNIIDSGNSIIASRGVCWNINPNPTIANAKTINGSGNGSFISNVTNLMPNTTYYLKSYATNSTGTQYGNQVIFTTLNNNSCGTISDIDGNLYNSVTIGTQCWISKNLTTTHYRNGDVIPQVTDSAQWANLTSGAWCYYNNDPSTLNTYGLIYNGFAAIDPRGIAPIGYRLPSGTDFSTLRNYLGAGIAGGKLKEIGFNRWLSPNSGATNETGFTGLPAGVRARGNIGFGAPTDFGGNGGFLFLHGATNSAAQLRYNSADLDLITVSNFNKSGGSIRCIKN